MQPLEYESLVDAPVRPTPLWLRALRFVLGALAGACSLLLGLLAVAPLAVALAYVLTRRDGRWWSFHLGVIVGIALPVLAVAGNVMLDFIRSA